MSGGSPQQPVLLTIQLQLSVISPNSDTAQISANAYVTRIDADDQQLRGGRFPGRPAGQPKGSRSLVDPIARTALRYSMSAREYATLHNYVISRSRLLKRAAPSVSTVEKLIDGNRAAARKDAKESRAASGGDDYNVRAVRHAIRVFLATGSLMKLYAVVSKKLKRTADAEVNSGNKQPPKPSHRRDAHLAACTCYWRLVRRSDAWHLPGEAATRIYYTFAIFRALEFTWNMCEEEGLVWGLKPGGKGKKERPWWFGSWMLQPFAFGQLLHAVTFDRDCFPMPFGNFIFGNSTAYLHDRPAGFPSHIKWPGTYDVVDSLARMAKLNWPPFRPPLITSLACATLHPGDPSCLRTYLTFWLRSFPPLARFFLFFYSVLAFPRFGALYNSPVQTLNRILARALRSSTFVTGSISTAWASICVFQSWFPKSFLATQRFFLGGFLAGLWAWVERRSGRGVFLYSARASVDSLWKVGVKRRWWRGMKGGDVWVFVLALMATGVVYERDRKAIKEGNWRKGVSWVRGEGLRDWSVEEDELVQEKDAA
ncbi:unnamed protein product [Parascedosporium putredinis]|uniref:Uncharacterized protein n=1 Tax=Parascedosporium putredinis TaxID=1442378 RepID=A0A9P1M6S6_9PEZI|nr:unnamed protein product [Parascedosporium putredinis]CAI7989001.1 unnamed protein product [Parascedosporium putredinis]